MKMKNFSCASSSSTTICSSIDQNQPNSIIKTNTKTLQRLNTYIGENYKSITNHITNTYSPSSKAPCISELPFNPRPSSFSKYREKTQKLTSVANNDTNIVSRRRSSADIMDLKRDTCNSSRYLLADSKLANTSLLKKYSTPVFCSEGRKSTSSIETTRFGMEEKERVRRHFSLIDVKEERRVIRLGMKQRNAGEIVSCDSLRLGNQKQKSMAGFTSTNDSLVQNLPPRPRSRDQVVVLRVSLHCKGCEGKLKRHLSKMEGVTSFSIDMDTKKVTVVGNVTPLEVLTSISKVKNAQFWPSQASDSSTSSSSSSTSSTTDFN